MLEGCLEFVRAELKAGLRADLSEFFQLSLRRQGSDLCL